MALQAGKPINRRAWFLPNDSVEHGDCVSDEIERYVCVTNIKTVLAYNNMIVIQDRKSSFGTGIRW